MYVYSIMYIIQCTLYIFVRIASKIGCDLHNI